MKLKDVRWVFAIGGVVAAEAFMIAAAFGWVAIYSYFINPGHTVEVYEAYAQTSGPYVALITGIPVFFLICRWISLRTAAAGWPTSMALFGVYCLLEAPLLFPAISQIGAWILTINFATKFAACYWGGRAAFRGAAQTTA